MARVSWTAPVLALTIAAVVAPAYSQEATAPVAAVQGPQAVVAEGTTSLAGTMTGSVQNALEETYFEVRSGQTTAGLTLTSEPVRVSNDQGGKAQVACFASIGRTGVRGKANVSVYVNGRRVERRKVAWTNAKARSQVYAEFYPSAGTISAGDELTCVTTTARKAGVALPNNTEIYWYVRYIDA